MVAASSSTCTVIQMVFVVLLCFALRYLFFGVVLIYYKKCNSHMLIFCVFLSSLMAAETKKSHSRLILCLMSYTCFEFGLALQIKAQLQRWLALLVRHLIKVTVSIQFAGQVALVYCHATVCSGCTFLNTPWFS